MQIAWCATGCDSIVIYPINYKLYPQYNNTVQWPLLVCTNITLVISIWCIAKYTVPVYIGCTVWYTQFCTTPGFRTWLWYQVNLTWLASWQVNYHKLSQFASHVESFTVSCGKFEVVDSGEEGYNILYCIIHTVLYDIGGVRQKQPPTTRYCMILYLDDKRIAPTVWQHIHYNLKCRKFLAFWPYCIQYTAVLYSTVQTMYCIVLQSTVQYGGIKQYSVVVAS